MSERAGQNVIVRNFEYLLALKRERHFARAAASCRVSQPTLSAGIKQLEEDMDVLIVRRGQRFEGFTPEGERVLAWAQQMQEDCNRLKQELHELRDNGLQGAFRIGMLAATSALASVLSVAFEERFPGLQITVETEDAGALAKSVRQGKLDVALTYIDEGVGQGLDAFALYTERMFLFTASEGFPEEQHRVSLEEMASLPLCLLRHAVPASLERRLVSIAKDGRLVFTDSPSVLAAHVKSGRWSTVLPQTLAAQLARTKGLRAIAMAKPNDQGTVGFVTVKSQPLPPAVHALMELAHEPDMVAEIRATLAEHLAFLPKRERKTAKP